MKHLFIKHNFRALIALFYLSFAFASCDDIEEKDRSIHVGEIEVTRTVLLEEFTGQLCTNCPQAAALAAVIKANLGEQFVVVSMHAGHYAKPMELYSELAQEYHDYFYTESQKAYPSGMISRTKNASSYIYGNYSNWESDVIKRLEKDFLEDREFSLDVAVEYEQASNTIKVNSTIETVDSLSGVKLQLWITESGIEAYQSGASIPDPTKYVHNHVLRDAVNGTWGEVIPFIEAEDIYETESTYSLGGKTWNPNNMEVVAFVYDENTKEVLYVIEKKLINN